RRCYGRPVFVRGGFNLAVSRILAMSPQASLPASVNGLLNNTHPLWVAIASVLFHAPRRPGLLVAGSAVALLGVGLVFLPDLAFGAAAGADASPLGLDMALAGSGLMADGTRGGGV